MPEQKKKGRKLQDLTKAELIEKVKTARRIYTKMNQTIERQNKEIAAQSKLLHEEDEHQLTLDAYAQDNAELRKKVATLKGVIHDKDEAIDALTAKLETLCTPIAVACRQVADAKQMLRPYWKNNGDGGQHQSAPSA